MRITSVDVFKADIPLTEPFRIATMTVDADRNVLVRINTDAGFSGWGEANPYWRIVGETQGTALAAAEDFARMLVGKDPLDVEARLDELSGHLARNGTILSAFDMALFDILGRAANLPLYAVLGGSARLFTTDRTIGMNPPEKMVADAIAFRARGFPAVKVKTGGDADRDVTTLRRIREAIGPGVPLRIDANQGWDETTAVRALRALEAVDIEYCEQPIAAWNVDGLRRVRGRTTVPLMADEAVFDAHDALRLIRAEACDYFNVKLSKSGGIREALRIDAVAVAAGVKCMLGCMTESRLGLTAAAHVVCARKNFVFTDLDGADFLAEDPIVGGMTYGPGGTVVTPDAPGLGVDVDPTFLRRCEQRSFSG